MNERGNAKLIPVIAIAVMVIGSLVSGVSEALGVSPAALLMWSALVGYLLVAGGVGAVVNLARFMLKIGAALLLWPLTLAYGVYRLYLSVTGQKPRDPEEVFTEEPDAETQERRARASNGKTSSKSANGRAYQQAKERTGAADTWEAMPDRKKVHIKDWANSLGVLGIEHTWTPTEETIQQRYKELAKEYHPDQSDADDAAEMMKAINTAKKYLKENDAPDIPEEIREEVYRAA